MKKVLISLGILILTFASTTKANALILDFEGLTINDAEDITNFNQGYGGFTWDATWVLYNDNIYPTQAHSGDYGLINNLGTDPLGFASNTAFDFNGVWISGWDSNVPAQIKAQGFDEFDNLVAETLLFDVEVNTNKYLEANFSGVRKVNFVGGQYFTLDDLSYDLASSSSAVPEPASIVLFGSGLVGAFLRRKRA